ncbi:MAG: 30S ribosomal protein S4 [Candidatus Moranbacteria bacterium RIFCSPHIGHO2_12_FULL_54_9]|nr:MAG: 30S ribosomal protein S4 [Candidatus Moranbacteria bacterium RIFCSPHIGHO2_01_FULL_54_31]OGI25810.1 MAG: 30S ribosomal protein S4 [Candidatus Moranbacteria bacterium RIFCSPHIGHO2_12_FULL_54_9]
MPNNIDSKCKLCRRAGEKLFLKGDRCMSPKCAMVRRPYAPGIHGHNPSRGGSEFGRQLSMKQKIKRLYGVMERQFRHHFDEVRKSPGITGDQLLSRLERRLDNVIYRLGFAVSRAQAKQLVSHKMFEVNGKRVNIPSFEVRVGDVIVLKQNKREKQFFKTQVEILQNKKDVPHWLALDLEKLTGKVLSMPARDDVGVRVDAQMVVEYYSK